VTDGQDMLAGNAALAAALTVQSSLLSDDWDLRRWLDWHVALPPQGVVQPKML